MNDAPASATMPAISSSAALPAFHRGVATTSAPPSSRNRIASMAGAESGAVQQRIVVEVLEELRVDLAARHALADRRVLVFEQPETR
jgi:hypothetical protein